MKYQWEASDIRAGLVIRSTTTNAVNAIFMIGYQRVDHGNEYLLISLADGLIVARGSTEELVAEFLNLGYRPYRIMFSEQVHDKFQNVSKNSD